jgi:FlaA1/EpsC-like NDP-sugar epimerase
MIRLSGRTEGYDATIEITGMRPGEKLHEELVAPEERPGPPGSRR